MKRSNTAPASQPAFRRLVLGAAFLAGLAIALAPRTPTVYAQQTPPVTAESKASPPAAEPKTTPPSKTVTITDGRGVEAKIEVRETSDTGAKGPADRAGTPTEDVPATGTDKPAPRNRNVTIGKHGKVTIDGIGKDREFDSFNEFVHDEPAIAAMVVAIVAVVFLAPVLAIGLILWYRMRKARLLNETMLRLAEKGVVAPADALEALTSGKQASVLATTAGAAPIYEQAKQIRRRAAWSDLRKGVFTGGVGLALTFYSMLDDREPNALGLILLFVGIGFIVLWWFEERRIAPTGSASGGMSGGQPPAA